MFAMLALNWQPQIRGILIIIIAVSVLCGSVYLILGTNVGARLGFLLALAGLSGWIFLMASIWWAYGIGLKGADATWKAVPGESILQTPTAIKDANIIHQDAALPAANASAADTATAIDNLLIANNWRRLADTDSAFGPSASAGGVVLEADGTLKAGTYQVINVFDKGGARYPKINNSLDFIAFLHKPHWIVVEAAVLLPQRAEPGRAPSAAEIDTTQPHRYVYMIRDLGDKRVPAALITFGSAIVFFSCCYLLHIRDRRVQLNRSGTLAVPNAN